MNNPKVEANPTPNPNPVVSKTFTSAATVPPSEAKDVDLGLNNLLTDNAILARPLQTADITRVKSKNPNLAFQWCNRKFQDGQRISEFEYEGFRKATPADCEIPGLSSVDGGFIYGDLILMKIDKASYRGALRHNALKSLQATRPAQVKKLLEGDREFSSAAAGSQGKIHPYNPSADDLKEKGLSE